MVGEIKICGLRDDATLEAALSGGADLVGFVRYAKSPRHLSLETGRALSDQAKGRAARVVLLVDADDAELDAAMQAFDPDLLQLHGSETPERLRAIRARTGRPVMKAIGIAVRADLDGISRYAPVADRLLLDAKPSGAGALPGGNGRPFDWTLIAGLSGTMPYMLSGGLSPETVADAIASTGARAVDVSSGVETAPGEKDPARIAAFIAAARAAFATLPASGRPIIEDKVA